MHTGSRDAYGRASDELDELSQGSADASTLGTIGDELYAVATVLSEHIDLRRALVDASIPDRQRTTMVEQLFGEKISSAAVSLLTTLVAARLSTSGDLVEATQDLGRDASLGAAEKNGTLSEVEDELFRFGRVLDREPRLRTLLADTTTPADKRVELLDSVLDGRVDETTHRLLAQAVRYPYTRPLDRTAEVLAEAAAARRDRSIARVTAPVVLGEEQERRLAESLSSLYGRQISVHTDVDPDIVGGLVIRVGNEVIDGSVASRLASAAQTAPR